MSELSGRFFHRSYIFLFKGKNWENSKKIDFQSVPNPITSSFHEFVEFLRWQKLKILSRVNQLSLAVRGWILGSYGPQTQHLRLNEYAKYLKISFFPYVTSHVTLDVYKCGINRRVLTVRIQKKYFLCTLKTKKLGCTLKTLKNEVFLTFDLEDCVGVCPKTNQHLEILIPLFWHQNEFSTTFLWGCSVFTSSNRSKSNNFFISWIRRILEMAEVKNTVTRKSIKLGRSRVNFRVIWAPNSAPTA